MASVGTEKGGLRRILFYAPDGSRKTIRLGKCSKRDADSLRLKVEDLLACKIRKLPFDRELAIWTESIDPRLRKKFQHAGLLEQPDGQAESKAKTVALFLDEYMERYGKSKKPGTREVWKQVMENLKTYLPTGILLQEVTAGHAKNFFESLKASGMASTTIYKRIGFARQFFNDALDWELIDKNPFLKVKPANATAKSNVEVPRAVIDVVLKHCDLTWKVIVTLSRYAGMRCPSEVLSLRWSDIDWEKGRMHITEPKVEHHAGRGKRCCPIFPEVLEILKVAKEQASEGAEYVIDHPEYRRAACSEYGWRNANLRTQFTRILKKAGVEPWDRLFHSMRASRQTELEAEFPLHVVCSWLGNSPRIAQRSYLLVTDDHFQAAIDSKSTIEKAARKAARSNAESAKNGTKSGTASACDDSQNFANSASNAGENAKNPANIDKIERRGQDSNLR
jgi:integrase